ncbi:hypothetical protein [Pararhizobium sp. PWRC1-1]|uniref:hypothetical protein n=1 Tax=Pararhizobium sp. PWRC1-1 TaxID=2804566 RepID=UPI003CECA88B
MVSLSARLLPTHARRSNESQALQQLSTPMPLAYVAARAAGIMPDDLVLEPSAGTGLLAIFAEIARARLALNEYACVRGLLLERLFPDGSVTRHDAAHIDDYLDRSVNPTVVLMKPPFSASVPDADWRQLASPFARLAPGGRLVAITGANLFPDNPNWRKAFMREWLKAIGLFSENIAWKTRFFVPMTGEGPAILSRLMERLACSLLPVAIEGD